MLDRNQTPVIHFHEEKQQLTQRNARQQCLHMTSCVHFHRHDMLTVPLTVLLHCPISSMKLTLSYWFSIRLVMANHVQLFCYSFDYVYNTAVLVVCRCCSLLINMMFRWSKMLHITLKHNAKSYHKRKKWIFI